MPKDKIKRVAVPAILAVLVAMTSTTLMTGAFAVGPTEVTRDGGLHFVGDPDVTASKTDEGATLTATGEVAGAGTGAGTATIEADVTATVGCITPSGSNEPQGLEEASAAVTATATFEPTRQGRGTFTVTTEPLTIEDFTVDGEPFACPSANMEETLVGAIEFSNIVLTINAQTGTITATFPDVDP